MPALPDFLVRAEAEQARLGPPGASRLLEAGRPLSRRLVGATALLFPHFAAERCGTFIAAAVQAALDSRARRVLALGVLHALNDELADARRRVAEGGDASAEAAWGVQGPGLGAREDWRREFSLSHFRWLWREECARRGGKEPELVLRYPFLAGGRPEALPGMDELERLAAEGAFILGTADPFHHGHAYGTDAPLEAEEGGLDAARASIEEGFRVMGRGDAAAWQAHCLEAKSDARDVGQVMLHLLGPLRGELIDLAWEDMSGAYGAEPPSWVAGGLIALTKEDRR